MKEKVFFEVKIPKEEILDKKKLNNIKNPVIIDQVSQTFYKTDEDFVSDAQKNGFVSRAGVTKPGAFKLLHEGKIVFLSRFGKDEKGTYQRIFGAYRVTGLATDLPVEVMEEIKKKYPNLLKEIKRVKDVVVRGCGTYEVTYETASQAPLSEVAETIYREAKERGIKVKFMVVGKYVPIKDGFGRDVNIIIRGLPSMRSIARIPLSEEELFEKVKVKVQMTSDSIKVIGFTNYHLGKEDIKQKRITEFFTIAKVNV